MDIFSIKLIGTFVGMIVIALWIGWNSHKQYLAKKGIQKMEKGTPWGALKFIFVFLVLLYFISFIFSLI